MANPDHLVILKRGVKEWNQWRETLHIKPDFFRANLIGVSLRGQISGGAILGVANLGGTPLRGATLRGADLGEANLCEADLSRAKLQNASLLTSRLINANFDGAILTEACLWKTQRAGWSIKGVICESIHWDAEKEKLDTFELGEFERLYSEKARVRIKYPGGSCHNQRVE